MADPKAEIERVWQDYRRTRDKALRDRLILNYAPLVKYVAGRLGGGLPAHVDEGDLVSYGLLGLIGAIERFDPAREIKFETYAISRIKGSIIDELRSLDWVPRSVRSRAREIERAMLDLENKLRRPPTDAEIAGAIGITEEEFQDSLTPISRTSVAALDELWQVSSSGGDAVSLIDMIEDPHAEDPTREMSATELREALADAIQRLPDREKPRDHALLLRGADPARDRRGARRDRVPRLAAAHEGHPAAEGADAGAGRAGPGRAPLGSRAAMAEPREIDAIWRSYRATRDQRACERLILAYAPLVKYVAGRLGGRLPAHVDSEDLVQWGLEGLLSAITRFDPTLGNKFETFAISHIRGKMIDELRRMDFAPRSLRARAREVERAMQELESKLGRPPNDDEVAAALGVPVEEFRTIISDIARANVAALDELWPGAAGEGDTLSLLDTLEDPNAEDPTRALRAGERKRGPARERAAPAGPREARGHALLLRGADAARDRRGAARDRVASVAAAHEGAPPPPRPPRPRSI